MPKNMDKKSFAIAVVQLVNNVIASFGLETKDEPLQGAMLDDCLAILAAKVDTDAVYRAKKRLLRAAGESLDKQRQAASEGKSKTSQVTPPTV